VVATVSLLNTCTYIPEILGANTYVKNSSSFGVDFKTASLQFMVVTSWVMGVDKKIFVGGKTINITTTLYETLDMC